MSSRRNHAWHLPMPTDGKPQPRRSLSAENVVQPTSSRQPSSRSHHNQYRAPLPELTTNANSSSSSASTSIVTPFSGHTQLPEINCSPTLALNFGFDESHLLMPKSRAYSPPRFRRPASAHGGIGSMSVDTVRQTPPQPKQQPIASTSSHNTPPISRKKGSTSSGGLLSDGSASGRSAQKIDFKRLMSKPAGSGAFATFSDSELDDKAGSSSGKQSLDSSVPATSRPRLPSAPTRKAPPPLEPWMRERTLPLPPQTTRSHAQAPLSRQSSSGGLESDAREERRSRQAHKRRASNSTPPGSSPITASPIDRPRTHNTRRSSPLPPPPPTPTPSPAHLTPASAFILAYKEKERQRESGGSSGSGSGGHRGSPQSTRSPAFPTTSPFDSSARGARVVAIGEPWEDAYSTWALAEERLAKSPKILVGPPPPPHSSKASSTSGSINPLQSLSRRISSKFPTSKAHISSPIPQVPTVHPQPEGQYAEELPLPTPSWRSTTSPLPLSANSTSSHDGRHSNLQSRDQSRDSRDRDPDRDKRRSVTNPEFSTTHRRERSTTIPAPPTRRSSYAQPVGTPPPQERGVMSFDLSATPHSVITPWTQAEGYAWPTQRLGMEEEWERERERKVSTPSVMGRSIKSKAKSVRGKSPAPSRSGTPVPPSKEEEEASGMVGAAGAKIWKLVRKLSSGTLRDRASRPLADEVPPLPPMPVIPTRGFSDDTFVREKSVDEHGEKHGEAKEKPKGRARTMSSKSVELLRNKDKDAAQYQAPSMPGMDMIARFIATKGTNGTDLAAQSSSSSSHTPSPSSRQTLPARPKTSSNSSRPALPHHPNSSSSTTPSRVNGNLTAPPSVRSTSPATPSDVPPTTIAFQSRPGAQSPGSSTSSYGEDLPSAIGDKSVGNYIVPPDELLKIDSGDDLPKKPSRHFPRAGSDDAFASSASPSPIGLSLPLPPRRATVSHRPTPESFSDKLSLPSSPISANSRSHRGLPARLRRKFSSQSPTESPTIPTFVTQEAVTIAPLSRRATMVRSDAPSQILPSSPTPFNDANAKSAHEPPKSPSATFAAQQFSPSTTQTNRSDPPPRPRRSSARRAPPAVLSIQAATQSRTAMSPVVALGESGSEGDITRRSSVVSPALQSSDGSAERGRHRSVFPSSTVTSRSRSRSRPRSNSLGTPPMPFTSSAFAFRELTVADSVTPPSGGMSQREKESKWEDLLARSERAGGTIQAFIPGYTGLLSDELEMDLNSPVSDED